MMFGQLTILKSPAASNKQNAQWPVTQMISIQVFWMLHCGALRVVLLSLYHHVVMCSLEDHCISLAVEHVRQLQTVLIFVGSMQ